MKIALTVVEDFLTHTKGEVITDPALVKEYVRSDYQAHFVKTEAPPTVTADAAAK